MGVMPNLQNHPRHTSVVYNILLFFYASSIQNSSRCPPTGITICAFGEVVFNESQGSDGFFHWVCWSEPLLNPLGKCYGFGMWINSGIRPNHLAPYHNGFNHAQPSDARILGWKSQHIFATKITGSEMVKLTVAQAEKMILQPTFLGKKKKEIR